jgi:hypothetical protein
MINLKTLKEEVLNEIILLPTFVEYGKLKLPAGKAVFDTHRMMVLQQVSDKFNLITLPQLITKLKKLESIRFINFYKTKSLDTVYLTGYFPKHKMEDDYIGFEMGISYISRFAPFIQLGIYFTQQDKFARLKMTESDIPAAINLYHMPYITILSKSFLEAIVAVVPRFMKKETNKIVFPYLNTPIYYRDYLSLLASVTKIWSSSSYELARNFQLNWSNFSTFTDIRRELE